MSKWRKALKNSRRFDARYFLGERNEGQEEVIENSVQQEKVKRNFHDFSFDSWLTEDQDLEEAHCTSKRDDKNKMEEESTDKYDDDPALKGKQSDLPDSLQKAIIDKKGVDEGRDGATKGHSQMSKATKKREKRPFDYEKGKIGDEVFEEEGPIGKTEEEPEYGESMEEIVGPQGKEPTFAPKPGEEEATGIKPHIVKILKKREDVAHLGPVPHDQHVEDEKNEG